jgi:hypothetical protein
MPKLRGDVVPYYGTLAPDSSPGLFTRLGVTKCGAGFPAVTVTAVPLRMAKAGE